MAEIAERADQHERRADAEGGTVRTEIGKGTVFFLLLLI